MRLLGFGSTGGFWATVLWISLWIASFAFFFSFFQRVQLRFATWWRSRRSVVPGSQQKVTSRKLTTKVSMYGRIYPEFRFRAGAGTNISDVCEFLCGYAEGHGCCASILFNGVSLNAYPWVSASSLEEFYHDEMKRLNEIGGKRSGEVIYSNPCQKCGSIMGAEEYGVGVCRRCYYDEDERGGEG